MRSMRRSIRPGRLRSRVEVEGEPGVDALRRDGDREVRHARPFPAGSGIPRSKARRRAGWRGRERRRVRFPERRGICFYFTRPERSLGGCRTIAASGPPIPRFRADRRSARPPVAERGGKRRKVGSPDAERAGDRILPGCRLGERGRGSRRTRSPGASTGGIGAGFAARETSGEGSLRNIGSRIGSPMENGRNVGGEITPAGPDDRKVVEQVPERSWKSGKPGFALPRRRSATFPHRSRTSRAGGKRFPDTAPEAGARSGAFVASSRTRERSRKRFPSPPSFAERFGNRFPTALPIPESGSGEKGTASRVREAVSGGFPLRSAIRAAGSAETRARVMPPWARRRASRPRV